MTPTAMSRRDPSHLAGPAVAVACFALLVVAARGFRLSSARVAGASGEREATSGPASGGRERRAAGANEGQGASAHDMEAPAGLALRDAAASLPELAGRVVAALGRRDRAALQALTLRRDEYRGLLFPRLTTDAHAGADFYFDNLAAGSSRDLSGALARLGGHALTLRSVAADPAQAERLGDVTVHRGVVMRLLVDGRPVDSSLLHGVVEWRGGHKLTRYRLDER